MARRFWLLAGIIGLWLSQAYPSPLIATTAVAQEAAPASTSTDHDIAGQWQGTLPGKKRLRLVFMVAQTGQGWTAKLYSIDQSGQPFNASSVTLDGSNFNCAIEVIGATYQATLSADGNSISGTWTQAANRRPLTLVHVAGKAAWKLPAPPKMAKLMDADADVFFSKATIKTNDAVQARMNGPHLNNQSFTAEHASVVDLISYAYEVQAKQIAGIPDWIAHDRYDLDATVNQKGEPTHQQLRVMVKKLLADRFHLSFHADKQQLAAYVLTTTKDGQKLTPTQFQGPLPGIVSRPQPEGFTVMVRNATMEEFAIFLQIYVLDRPVVDLTGLQDRFDFQFTFTPDDSQFDGHPPKLPPTAAGPVEPALSLAKALRQKLGLELTPQDAFVDIIVVDHVEKPSLK